MKSSGVSSGTERAVDGAAVPRLVAGPAPTAPVSDTALHPHHHRQQQQQQQPAVVPIISTVDLLMVILDVCSLASSTML